MKPPPGTPTVTDLVIADLQSPPPESWNNRDPLAEAYGDVLTLARRMRQDLRERAILAPLLDELIRAAKAAVEGITDVRAGEVKHLNRLQAALGAYGSAHFFQTDLQPPIPDPNEDYDHRRSTELAREALRTHPRDEDGRLDIMGKRS